MKKFLFTLTLLAACSMVAKADIQFNHGPWQEILAQATKEKKMVFVDAFTTWCGPCKWMAANTFTNQEVADFFNANFINAKIDMENGEGVGLAQKYDVKAYPTLLFVAGNGELVHVAVGALNPEQFMALGKEVLDPKFVSLSMLKAEYEAHSDDHEVQAKYLLKMMDIGQNTDEVFARFRPSMAGEGLLDQTSWKVFKTRFKRLDSEEAKYFFAHRAEFEARFGKEEVASKVADMYFNAMRQAISKQDEAAYKEACDAMLKSGIPDADKVVLFQDIDFYEATENWAKFSSQVQKAVSSTPDLPTVALNSYAWKFFLHVDKDKDLKKALEWSSRTCELEPIYAYLDTKAMLLMKLGRKDEAIATAKKAIEVAKANGEEYGDTEVELNKMLGK